MRRVRRRSQPNVRRFSPRPPLRSTTSSCSFRSLRRSAGRSFPRECKASPGTVTRVTRSPTCSNSQAVSEMATQGDERLPFPSIGTDPASVRQRVEAMEKLLERLFVILDLIPGVGDIAGAALGAYIVWEARNLGMSKWQIARMSGNVGFDFLLGL